MTSSLAVSLDRLLQHVYLGLIIKTEKHKKNKVIVVDLLSVEKLAWIQLELKLPDEDDSDEVEVEVPPSGDVRRLGDSHVNYVTGKGHSYETGAGESTGRQLQEESTTQVCYFYSDKISFHAKQPISTEAFCIHNSSGLR